MRHNDEIKHYGVKGMEWGKRKEDGTSNVAKSGTGAKITDSRPAPRGTANREAAGAGMNSKVAQGGGGEGRPGDDKRGNQLVEGITKEEVNAALGAIDEGLAELGRQVGNAAQPLINDIKDKIDSIVKPSLAQRAARTVNNANDAIRDFFNPSPARQAVKSAEKAIDNAKNWIDDLFK